jgi:WD40 repeat protein
VIDALVVSPDGRVAISTGNDHTLHWWDLESRIERLVVDRIPQKVTALTFAPDGRTLFSGEEDGSIGVWDARNGELLRRFRAHSLPVTAIALSRDGTHLVSGSSDRLLKIWRLDWSYTLPAQVNSDATLLAYLDAFILVHRPYANGGMARAGKSNWNQADYDQLVQDLSFRGYGGMDEDELIGLLRQRSR